MALHMWLKGAKMPNTPNKKRPLELDSDQSTPPKKFSKLMNQESYSWYQKDENGIWHCTLCRAAKFDNKYAAGHEHPQKTTNHARHMKSGDHTTAVIRDQNINKKHNAKESGVQELLLNQLSKDDQIVKTYLKVAYHLAKEELPKSQFRPTLKLIESIQEETLHKSDKTPYTSDDSITEFQSIIANQVRKVKLQFIQSSPRFSISVDESTDLANKKRLIIYVEYLSNNIKHTCFLSNIQLEAATADAETITNAIVDTVKEHGLDINKLVGISTDGASVMTGRKSGVVVRLRDHAPSLIGVHCAAHRCSLAASQAAKAIPELQSYSRTVSNIFHYFSNSALRSNKLREIQKLMCLPEIKYAEVHSVRWLSLDRAVRIIYRTYPALLVALSHEASSNATAKGLFQEVEQYKFIMITHLLLDILPFLTRLSKVFQTESADFSKIESIVTCTVDSLSDLKISRGWYVESLDEFVIVEGEKVVYRRTLEESEKRTLDENIGMNVDGFDGFDSGESDDCSVDEQVVSEVELKYHSQQKNMLSRVMGQYIDKIIENLEDRFRESESVSKFKIFVPKCIATANRQGSETFLKFGHDELKSLLDKFEKCLEIDREACLSEYRQFKRLVVGSFNESSFASCAESILADYHEILSNLVRLLEVGMLIPISSVPCERGFSTQNRILSRLRTRLSNKALNDLMMISENGPDIKSFAFTDALQEWKTLKARKIYRLSQTQ